MLWTYSQFPEIPGNNSGSERLKDFDRTTEMLYLALVVPLNNIHVGTETRRQNILLALHGMRRFKGTSGDPENTILTCSNKHESYWDTLNPLNPIHILEWHISQTVTQNSVSPSNKLEVDCFCVPLAALVGHRSSLRRLQLVPPSNKGYN